MLRRAGGLEELRMNKKAKVLVVDDSLFFRTAVTRGLSEDPDIEIVGEASDPYDARDKILALEPDVMTMDIEMPFMSGVEFLKILIPQWPIPVIVVSSARQYFSEAMKAGAFDCIPKPVERTSDKFSVFINDIIKKVKIATSAGTSSAYLKSSKSTPLSGGHSFPGFIAIGASTGGTQATSQIIKKLPADMPGMVVVQHMPPVFTRMYAENLDRVCDLNIVEAKNGDEILPGRVLVAPGERQMEVVKNGTGYFVRCYEGPKVGGHCPSVDVLFSSVAKVAGKNAVGVILTGMGSDGARGLLEMRKKGAYTIGQDARSCVVYGMPKEAFDLGAVCRQVPLSDIPGALLNHLKTKF